MTLLWNPYPPEEDSMNGIFWHLNYPLPLPGPWLKCPVCEASSRIIPRWWKFHKRHPQIGSQHPYRVDVAFKCGLCAAIWTHGVRVDEEYWTTNYKSHHVYRREAMKILGMQVPPM